MHCSVFLTLIFSGNQVPVLCELLERSESETVSLSLACASAIVHKLSSSQSKRAAVLKHFVGTYAYSPSASIAGPPSPSLCLSEALIKLLHQKKCNLNDPQVTFDPSVFHFALMSCSLTIPSDSARHVRTSRQCTCGRNDHSIGRSQALKKSVRFRAVISRTPYAPTAVR